MLRTNRGDGKAQVLTTWVKEFMANVLVQFVHAVIYVVMVETGLRIYMDNHDNWMLFVISIMFLFPAEGILRGVLGLKASTVSELKGTFGKAATAIGATVMVAKLGANGKSKEEQEEEKKKAEAKEIKRKQQREEKKDKKNEVKKKRREHADSRASSTSGVKGRYYEMKKQALEIKDKAEDIVKNSNAVKNAAKLKSKAHMAKLRLQQSKLGKNVTKAKKFTKSVNDKTRTLRKAGRMIGAYGTAVASALAAGGSSSDFMSGAALGSTLAGTTGKVKHYKEKADYVPAGKRKKIQAALDARNGTATAGGVASKTASAGSSKGGASSGGTKTGSHGKTTTNTHTNTTYNETTQEK